MATELLSIDDTDDTSADITVVDGATATVFLKTASGGSAPVGARVFVEAKDDGGNYNVVGMLTEAVPALAISGTGTYRLRREAGVEVGAAQG